MLVTVGEARTTELDARLAITLAAVAGAANAAGFHAAGVFSANMTGNVSLLSDNLAQGLWGPALLFLIVVLSFVLGAFAAAMFVRSGRRRSSRTTYAMVIVGEGILLCLLGLADIALPVVHSSPVLVVGLSLLMGLQNATTTMVSASRVRSTHVSGVATDLGIDLAALATREGGETQMVRVRLQLLTLGAFLVGGVLGVLLHVWAGGLVFILLAAALLAAALPQVIGRKA